MTLPRYLLTYDAVAFLGYLDTIQAANSVTTAKGAANYQSPWLLTDQAGIIFREGKRRCYSLTTKEFSNTQLDVDEEAWEALDEIQGIVGGRIARQGNKQSAWPKGLEPTLEEQPKWARLVDILDEIEEEIRSQQISSSWARKDFRISPLWPLMVTSRHPWNKYDFGHDSHISVGRHGWRVSIDFQPEPSTW